MLNLANKYRPTKWSDVVAQESIVKILSRQIATNQIENTYIFSGTSGCGKTTLARILANEINQYQGAPIEIDAASNNGVDNVKQIVASAAERSVNSAYKVYIIDEAHMLTTQAWNAFLKCIEEPPLYTIFIFCTTDPQKIPDTIKNRCMRFNFTRIPASAIKVRLLEICKAEGITECIDVCDYISRVCNGEMRNALSMLDTCLSYDSVLTLESAQQALGLISHDTYFSLINDIIDGNVQKVLDAINKLYQAGIDLEVFITSFTKFCLDVVRYILTQSISTTSIPESYEEKLKFSIGFANPESYYFYIIDKLLELKTLIKQDTDCKSTIEIILSQMCRLK